MVFSGLFLMVLNCLLVVVDMFWVSFLLVVDVFLLFKNTGF